MMEPFRQGKEPGHANKRLHQRGRRPFTSLVLTSIRAIITPAPPPAGTVDIVNVAELDVSNIQICVLQPRRLWPRHRPSGTTRRERRVSKTKG